jgi:hypothetical protein
MAVHGGMWMAAAADEGCHIGFPWFISLEWTRGGS